MRKLLRDPGCTGLCGPSTRKRGERQQPEPTQTQGDPVEAGHHGRAEEGRSCEHDGVHLNSVSWSHRITGASLSLRWSQNLADPQGGVGGDVFSEDNTNCAGSKGTSDGGAQGSGSVVGGRNGELFIDSWTHFIVSRAPQAHPQAWLVRKAASLLSSVRIENAWGCK